MLVHFFFYCLQLASFSTIAHAEAHNVMSFVRFFKGVVFKHITGLDLAFARYLLAKERESTGVT